MSPCPWCGVAANELCKPTCAATPMQRRENRHGLTRRGRPANDCCNDPACDAPPREAERFTPTPTPPSTACGCHLEPIDGHFFTDQQLATFVTRTVYQRNGNVVFDSNVFMREIASRGAATPAKRCSACGTITPGRCQ